MLAKKFTDELAIARIVVCRIEHDRQESQQHAHMIQRTIASAEERIGRQHGWVESGCVIPWHQRVTAIMACGAKMPVGLGLTSLCEHMCHRGQKATRLHDAKMIVKILP